MLVRIDRDVLIFFVFVSVSLSLSTALFSAFDVRLFTRSHSLLFAPPLSGNRETICMNTGGWSDPFLPCVANPCTTTLTAPTYGTGMKRGGAGITDVNDACMSLMHACRIYSIPCELRSCNLSHHIIAHPGFASQSLEPPAPHSKCARTRAALAIRCQERPARRARRQARGAAQPQHATV